MPQSEHRGLVGIAGRRADNCTGAQNRDSANGWATGNGAVCGLCGWFNASDLAGRPALETEKKLIMEEIDALESQLDKLDNRLDELKKNN